MHDLLLAHQGSLQPDDLSRYAAEIGLDAERFEYDLRARTGASNVAEDVESADLSGVAGTPTFFVNGLRHHGAYDIASLSAGCATPVSGARKAAAAQASTRGRQPVHTVLVSCTCGCDERRRLAVPWAASSAQRGVRTIADRRGASSATRPEIQEVDMTEYRKSTVLVTLQVAHTPEPLIQ